MYACILRVLLHTSITFKLSYYNTAKVDQVCMYTATSYGIVPISYTQYMVICSAV